MRKMLIGAGKYIQGKGALASLAEIIYGLGDSAFIIGGANALRVSLEKIEAVFRSNNIQYKVKPFTGYCSHSQINSLSAMVEAYAPDLVLGVGGGRCLDTAKAVADNVNLPIITVPTSAATCSAWTPTSIMYNDDGEPAKAVLTSDQSPHCVVIDMDVLCACPARLLASGIGDSLAKLPEICHSGIDISEVDIYTCTAIDLAKLCTDILLAKGEQAYLDNKSGYVSSELKDVIGTNIFVTGTIGSLARGSYQLALAHSLHDAFIMHFKEQVGNFYHGELVTVGMFAQLAYNNIDRNEIESIKQFAQSIGLPCSLDDLGIESMPNNIDLLMNYLQKNPWFPYTVEVQTKIRDALSSLQE